VSSEHARRVVIRLLVRILVYGLLVLIVAAILFPVFAKAKMTTGKDRCSGQIRQMIHGLDLYATDNQGRLPVADRWMDSIFGYLNRNETLFHEPDDMPKGTYGYAMEGKASALAIDTVAKPRTYPLVFDSSLSQRNAVGNLTSLPRPQRHFWGNHVGYLDGNVGTVRGADR
jgi:hypothetical protein